MMKVAKNSLETVLNAPKKEGHLAGWPSAMIGGSAATLFCQQVRLDRALHPRSLQFQRGRSQCNR